MLAAVVDVLAEVVDVELAGTVVLVVEVVVVDVVVVEVVELVVELEVVEDEVLELEAVVEVDDVLVELEVSGSPPIHTQVDLKCASHIFKNASLGYFIKTLNISRKIF